MPWPRLNSRCHQLTLWNRWTEVRDPATQLVLRHERRFKADKLQKCFQQLGNALGFSKQQVRDAIERLESAGYITKELHNFPTKDGAMLTNVMFLEPAPEAIERLAFRPVTVEELPLESGEIVATDDFGEVVTARPYGPGTTSYVLQTTPWSTEHTLVHRTHIYTDHDTDHYKVPLPCSRRGEAIACAK